MLFRYLDRTLLCALSVTGLPEYDAIPSHLSARVISSYQRFVLSGVHRIRGPVLARIRTAGDLTIIGEARLFFSKVWVLVSVLREILSFHRFASLF